MPNSEKKTARVFKTALFSKRAKKARIKDDERCTAIKEVMIGQAVDLGDQQIVQLLNDGDFVEICHGEKDQVQK